MRTSAPDRAPPPLPSRAPSNAYGHHVDKPMPTHRGLESGHMPLPTHRGLESGHMVKKRDNNIKNEQCKLDYKSQDNRKNSSGTEFHITGFEKI